MPITVRTYLRHGPVAIVATHLKTEITIFFFIR